MYAKHEKKYTRCCKSINLTIALSVSTFISPPRGPLFKSTFYVSVSQTNTKSWQNLVLLIKFWSSSSKHIKCS